MLFQRLYNWIRYKTLPTSFLFKNRLFIERDSKNRRIFTNWGLTFRSSKWGHYDTFNLKPRFEKRFTKLAVYVFCFFAAAIYAYFFKSLYFYFYFYNDVAFIYWLSIDSWDYYTTFLAWMLTVCFAVVANLAHSYLFFNKFSIGSSSKQTPHFQFFNQTPVSTKPVEDVLKFRLEQSDLTWFYYTWLNSSRLPLSTPLVTSLFETLAPSSQWLQVSSQLQRLFKAVFFLTNTEERVLPAITPLTGLRLYARIPGPRLFGSPKQSLTLSLLTTFTSAESSQPHTAEFLATRFVWNTQNIYPTAPDYQNLLKVKTLTWLQFYRTLGDLSAHWARFPEAWASLPTILDSGKVVKTHRWLYKYSVLHRKVLKNSHKLTCAKRLISSGFYDINLFDKNLWASAYSRRMLPDPSILLSFYRLLYTQPLTVSGDLPPHICSALQTHTQSSGNTGLGFYEQSFFWYLKRFFFSIRLSTNKFTLSPALAQTRQSLSGTPTGAAVRYQILSTFFNHSTASLVKTFTVTPDTVCDILESYPHYVSTEFVLQNPYYTLSGHNLFGEDLLTCFGILTVKECLQPRDLTFNNLIWSISNKPRLPTASFTPSPLVDGLIFFTNSEILPAADKILITDTSFASTYCK